MAKSKKIDRISSVNKLTYIQDTICQISIERIESAVNSIKKESTASTLMRVFSDFNNNFAEEEERLKENESSHNANYANKDNLKYSTAYNSLSCIKTSIYGLERVMNAFSPKTRTPKKYYQTDTQSIEFMTEHSLIGNLPYQPYMFDEKTPTQQRLILEILAFLQYLHKNLARCKRIVEDETRIGEDNEQCLLRLEQQIEELYQLVKNKKTKVIKEDYYKDLLSIDIHPENARKYWHKLTPAQLIPVSVALKEKRLSGYTETERKAFDFDEKRLSSYRKMISSIIKHYSKISGEILVYAYMYSNCTATQSAFYYCFKETYTSLGGTASIVSLQAFGQAYAKYAFNISSENYQIFRGNMDVSSLKDSTNSLNLHTGI